MLHRLETMEHHADVKHLVPRTHRVIIVRVWLAGALQTFMQQTRCASALHTMRPPSVRQNTADLYGPADPVPQTASAARPVPMERSEYTMLKPYSTTRTAVRSEVWCLDQTSGTCGRHTVAIKTRGLAARIRTTAL